MNVILWLDQMTLRGSVLRSLELATALTNQGHDVLAITHGGPMLKLFSELGCQTFVAKKLEKHLTLPFMGDRELQERIRRFKPDICHLSTLGESSLVRRFALKYGARIVATLLSSGDPSLDDKTLWGDVSAVITISQSMRAEIAKRTGLSTAQIRIIHPGVAQNEVRQRLPRENRREQRQLPVIGFFGPPEDFDAITALLRAGRELQRRDRAFHLLFVGEGPATPEIRDWIKNNDAGSWVVIVDELYDYRDIVRKANVVVAAEDSHETVAFALEALAQGIPAVLAAKGGNFELIEDEKAGLLYPPSDASALADRLERLLSDPLWRERYAERGRMAVAKNLPLEKMLEKTLEVYESALDGTNHYQRGKSRHSSSARGAWTTIFRERRK